MSKPRVNLETAASGARVEIHCAGGDDLTKTLRVHKLVRTRGCQWDGASPWAGVRIWSEPARDGLPPRVILDGREPAAVEGKENVQ